ncbi:MAG: hypothetical protein ACK47F_05845 [Flavobacteriales bacterium]
MKTKFSCLALLFVVTMTACQSDSTNTKDPAKDEIAGLENEGEYEDRIGAVENNTDLKVMNSLDYNDNAGSREEAVAYLDAADNVVKIEEVFSDVKTGNYGVYTFYVDKGKKFATKEVYFDNQLKVPSFVERLTFYDEKEKPVFTRERLAPFEDELSKEAFQTRSPRDLSIDRAMRIINQEAEFETTFQGFAEGGNLKYLLVGENTPDGFASSLAVQYQEGDIKKLLANERAMVGTPLEVEHEIMVDERGLKFQVLLSVKIK